MRWIGAGMHRLGSGPGLAFCRGIIEAHRGRIWASASEGGGTIFTVVLPLGSSERILPGARILVVDDEKEIVRALSRSLTAHGYTVFTARTGEEAVRTTLQRHPDLLLLDLLLPGMSGMEVCHKIREHSNVPIIVLSVKETERDKVEALDQGADDYIQKPFGMNEVLARIRVALRHVASTQTGTEPQIQAGPLLLDIAQRCVRRNGQIIDLTPTEYDLLKILLTHRGKILTRQMLLQTVWSTDAMNNLHNLHVHVANLRQKVELDPLHPRLILTIPGVGYRFDEDEIEREHGFCWWKTTLSYATWSNAIFWYATILSPSPKMLKAPWHTSAAMPLI